MRHSLTKSHVFAVEEMEEGLPSAMLDRNKIEQVFVNLMINAIDAMPTGGTLIVRTRRDRLTVMGSDVGVRKTDRFQVGQSVMVRHDGPVSVLRAFKPRDLIRIAQRANVPARVHRSFPFRLVLVAEK